MRRPATDTYPGRVIRTLVADDSPAVVDSLCHALGQYSDIEVIGTASNGAEAVRLARTLRPDVILMDLRMPIMDGIKATRFIVAAQLPACVLMLTAYDDESLVRDAMDAGADGYLVKGTLVSDTVVAIRAAVGRREVSSRPGSLHPGS
jgi:DNA-binding NarL/FixJ family response regulator